MPLHSVSIPIFWTNVDSPSPLQTRFHGCSHATHQPRQRNHPANSPASFSQFLADCGTHCRQIAAAFASITVTLPPRIFGTPARSTRLLPPRRLAPDCVRFREQRCSGVEARAGELFPATSLEREE